MIIFRIIIFFKYSVNNLDYFAAKPELCQQKAVILTLKHIVFIP
jgi:hypothetical protein